ncbi:TOTE conflict system archaeo-eukaryotic primase domain-containing protein [Paenibacillus cremeus]|uniref:TOTE conflict system primase domain-containing protein n=1 Tax=Paenibacillus cremeus TaxID=2163881 RepID=A0A559KCZ5_9BACL|nr:hypothetical protein [Paenibacillus cremeus]TVY09992.1 hypothetical protein FPZ49_11515 [Paenibacillus cremeus]
MDINQGNIIKQLSDLYLIQRGHYLIQDKNYGYRDYRKGEISKSTGKKYKALLDYMIESHLNGEYTVGTFCKEVFTKFITIDVDYKGNLEMSKLITNKISEQFTDWHIPEHYISFSGNKGYHIDIFFDDLIQWKHAKKFYEHLIKSLNLDDKKVEFRPTSTQGVKLPLGIHQETGNYCGFCYPDNLTVMSKENSEEFLFNIKKIQSESILDIIGLDINTSEKIDTKQEKNKIISTEDAISPHKPLPSYEQSEDSSIDRAQDLLLNGLKVQGSRHNSVLLLGMYLKYCGLSQEQNRAELYAWMEWQNPNTYTTPLDECCRDIDQLTKDIYEKNYNLSANQKDLTVTCDEIKWIMNNCPEKNQKLITYAMLIHSKRHANKQGVFYMPFKDIETATGLYDQAVQAQVNKLIKLGVVECIERGRKPKGKGLAKMLPNLYRMNYQRSLESDGLIETEVFTTEELDNFDVCLRFYFSDKELRKNLSQRQYKSLLG